MSGSSNKTLKNSEHNANKGNSKIKEIDLLPKVKDILSHSNIIEIKPQHNCNQQISNLKDNHKLNVLNEDKLIISLIDYGYYRLMGYKKIFLTTYDLYSDDKSAYKWGGTFERDSNDIMLLNLVDFDVKLSSLLLKNILKVEKLVKSRAAFFMADYYKDPYFYIRDHMSLNEKDYIFTSKEKWIKFMNEDYLKILNRGVKRDSNKAYMVHYKNKYHGNLPIWIYLKECTIGNFESLLKNIKNHQKLIFIERTFFSKSTFNDDLEKYVDPRDVINLITIIRHFRNRCAHGSRIYDFKYNFILRKRSNNEKFMNEFTNDKKIHIDNFANILSCFLRTEDYMCFKEEYDDLIKSLNIFPKVYRERIYKEIGIKLDIN